MFLFLTSSCGKSRALLRQSNLLGGVLTRSFSSRSSAPSIEKLQSLAALFQIPRQDRDKGWQTLFCAHVTEASLKLGSPDVKQGPDGFLYMHLTVPISNEPFEAYSIENLREPFLMKNGLGVVVESSKDTVEWVFSHGDIVNLHLNNEYFTKRSCEEKKLTKGEFVISAGTEYLVGQPSESYLPDDTRNAIRTFLEVNGVKNPKVTLLVRKPEGQNHAVKELCFYCEKSSSKDMNDIYKEGVAWYLPRQYNVLFVHNDDGEFSFQDL